MNVGEEQRHGAAACNFPGFVQVALRALGAGRRGRQTPQPGAGQEAAREMVLLAGAAEAGDGCFDFRF